MDGHPADRLAPVLTAGNVFIINALTHGGMGALEAPDWLTGLPEAGRALAGERAQHAGTFRAWRGYDPFPNSGARLRGSAPNHRPADNFP